MEGIKLNGSKIYKRIERVYNILGSSVSTHSN